MEAEPSSLQNSHLMLRAPSEFMTHVTVWQSKAISYISIDFNIFFSKNVEQACYCANLYSDIKVVKDGTIW